MQNVSTFEIKKNFITRMSVTNIQNILDILNRPDFCRFNFDFHHGVRDTCLVIKARTAHILPPSHI